MFVDGTKKEKIAFLSEFYERRFNERNFKFRAIEISDTLSPKVLAKEIIKLSHFTGFRIMKLRDNKGDYFIICKL